jgi:hypothetical protein
LLIDGGAPRHQRRVGGEEQVGGQRLGVKNGQKGDRPGLLGQRLGQWLGHSGQGAGCVRRYRLGSRRALPHQQRQQHSTGQQHSAAHGVLKSRSGLFRRSGMHKPLSESLAVNSSRLSENGICFAE